MTFLQPDFVYQATGAGAAIAGSFFDVRSRRIPNFVTGPAILLGLCMHLAIGGWKQLLTSFAAAMICGLIFLAFYLAGGMGAGDVKLIMAVGCIAGLSSVPYLLVLTAISGGVMAIGLAVMRGRLQQTFSNVAVLATHHSHAGLTPHPDLNITNVQTLRLPYALAIAGRQLVNPLLPESIEVSS